MTAPRPPSKGYVNQDGYRRLWVRHADGRRRMAMEHVVVWERHNGPVPAGHHVHHVNRDRLDNRIENLQCLTELAHKRVHSGCYQFDGRWWKRCKRCRWFRPIDQDFYVYREHGGAMGYCKRCASELAVEHKKRRRARRRLQSQQGVAPPVTENTPADAGVSSEGGLE